MQWPDTVELTLDGIAQGGEGVGRWQGRVVFAAGGLPGEHVRVRLYERHDAYAHGSVTELLVAAPERVPPRMPGADHIPWQHIDYPAQLRFKRQILAEQLAKIAGLADLPIAEMVPSPRPWHYRNSARFHVANGQIGYYAAGSRDLQPITQDPLLLPVLNEALRSLQAVLRPLDQVSEVLLRASETYGYVVAELRGTGDLMPLARRWRDRSPALAGVVLPAGLGLGADHTIEELDGIAFQLQPTTFFQVNVASAQVLLQLIRAGLAEQEHGRLLDLYCGAGAFTLPLARHADQALGVEEYPAAIADAQANAQANGISNALFLAGRVERVMAQLEGPFDAAVLDPPRRGAHPEALEALLRRAPPAIVYVSCQPATLARDLVALTANGYHVERITPVDLFPQTAHIESVCVLRR